MELKNELQVARELAERAAAAILEVRERARQHPRDKGGGQGPVTEADLRADEIIRTGLQAAFPEDVVVTEETWTGAESPVPTGPRVWFVDPLDGTEDFIAGGPDYAVMIGLALQGLPALGVVLQPETARCWWGVVGRGATRREPTGAESSLRVAERALPEEGGRLAMSRSHPTPLTDFVATEIGARPIKRGSVGLKIALIADDEADLYVSGSRRIKVWDTCGPRAILEAAGGTMTSLDQTPLSYVDAPSHPRGIFAATPAARAAYRDTVVDAVTRWREAHPPRRPEGTAPKD